MPAWAKFCSECGKPLNEGAKFCSECGAGVGNNTKIDQKEEKIDKNSLQFVSEKLKSLDEFCVYLNSSNRLTCMQKFPDCKFRFEENVKELQKETLSDLQKSLLDLYLLKWNIIETSYRNIMNNYDVSESEAYVAKINKGITELLTNTKNAKWGQLYLEACNKCIDLQKYNFKVTNGNYLDLSNGTQRDKMGFFKVAKGKAIRILDVSENKFLLIARTIATNGFCSGWVSREEVYKRTNLKERPVEEKIKEIDKIQKLLK